MKTTRYQFEQTVHNTTNKSTTWLKEEFKAILESDKDYTRKADYIGFSVLSIDDRIQSIDEEIQELQSLKNHLKTAKSIVLTTGAEIFKAYGIDKLDGAGISSITVTRATTTDKTKIVVTNAEALIDAGLYRRVLDEAMLSELYNSPQYGDIIKEHTHLDVTSIPKPSKLKINKRRGINNSDQALTGEVA